MTAQACYVCKGNSTSRARQVNEYCILRCSKCGLYWVDPMPSAEELTEFYSSEYYQADSEFGYADYLLDQANHRQNFGWILDRYFPEGLAGHRILDFGCGVGFLVDEANRRGAEGVGVEFSAFARDQALHCLGLKLFSSLDKIPGGAESFDSIYIVGVIEHLTDPRETLAKLWTLLKPGGTLVISTIDTEGLLPLYSFKPPEHLIYFNHRNLRALVEQANFEAVEYELYWVSYHVHDVLKRLGDHFWFPPLRWASQAFLALCGARTIRIPTNELVMAARKPSRN